MGNMEKILLYYKRYLVLGKHDGDDDDDDDGDGGSDDNDDDDTCFRVSQ